MEGTTRCMRIGEIEVSRQSRDLVFERDGYAIAMRTTVGNRVTLTFSFDGAIIGQVAGVRANPAVIVGVIEGALDIPN